MDVAPSHPVSLRKEGVIIPIAIVGNGAAAAEAILALRKLGYDGDIHLFAENDHPPYNPMLGTYLISGAVPLERAFPFGDHRAFYEGNRLTPHLHQAVTQLDAAEQTLTTADGNVHHYSQCLIASGARPLLPPIPGLREALAPAPARLPTRGTIAHGQRVFTMRSLDDALRLRQAVADLKSTDSKRVAVIGASFVGVKVGAVLHGLGLRVCLIEREPNLLPVCAQPACAHLMERHLVKEGYELRLGAVLVGVETGTTAVRLHFDAPSDISDPGAGETSCNEDAAQEDVDLVVVCTGIRPSLDFVTPGQVAIGEGILVDEQMRSSVTTLYAAGDVAQGKNLISGRHEIIGLWSSARYQGRAAGCSLAGAPSEYPGGIPHNITHVGRMIFATAGCLRDYDRVRVWREGDGLQVRVWRDQRLVGANSLNRCLAFGVVKQALLKAATGVVTETEATWISFSE
jgi:NADPH-dependent 2,4-dienoyl-CoA reductase/sulfur reductase-like enzyme